VPVMYIHQTFKSVVLTGKKLVTFKLPQSWEWSMVGQAEIERFSSIQMRLYSIFFLGWWPINVFG